MKKRTGVLIIGGMALAGGLLLPASSRAQGADHAGPVARMMAFDKNKDGKLTRDEVTDSRLSSLFDQADANKDGVLTREELTAFFGRNASLRQAGAPGGFGPGGPGRPGGFGQGRGPGGGPPGGFGGPGGPGGPGGRGFGGPPQPGQIMPAFLQDRLNLSDAQKKQIAALQKEVDTKLDKILTADQKKQLKAMRERRPGGPGGPGGPPPGGFGPGGPGGPGGPPPGGPDGPGRGRN